MYLKYIALIINYASILCKKYQMYLCIIWMSAPIEIAYHINLFLGNIINVYKNIPPLTARCLK